ncbi:RNA polymerase sigma-I factor [Desulfosporosinus sp. BICA1-9]|uniref:RNA polymerase sigma-I factor n=1 Tax=Desulfosporosinus sp. BICA1-9 TaxID=1531958 RepID=UPI00054B735D|nr:RNA polymerase sigma-I factor [Desulfosporosinus sp. BICA1-9]KJS84126.1 MAG: RNA polymerase sigma factor SigI [Desulfosporosinus sp. BICA1-9]KJS87148.1 MAG: RNA polymerase sigma factor SigI [Desulfosporosinus sp. BICA1-9]HBV85394.1 RNA polymerase sigma-I factor [Desulfosporosinus sp.]
MPELTIQQTLLLAKEGNELIREEFIQNHKPFIMKICFNICKRYLTWGHDDELSIALVAFNEAIDSFKPNDGASFYGFAKTVITRRLIDYFRKESKHQVLSLTPLEADKNDLYDYDSASSFELYKEEEQKNDFAETTKNYTIVLAEYGITLEDLVEVSPKHRDSKSTLWRVAQELCEHPNLLKHLTKTKLLPLKELELLTGVKRKVLERGRKYLIATVLILSDPEFVSLKSFTQIDQ